MSIPVAGQVVRFPGGANCYVPHTETDEIIQPDIDTKILNIATDHKLKRYVKTTINGYEVTAIVWFGGINRWTVRNTAGVV